MSFACREFFSKTRAVQTGVGFSAIRGSQTTKAAGCRRDKFVGFWVINLYTWPDLTPTVKRAGGQHLGGLTYILAGGGGGGARGGRAILLYYSPQIGPGKI